MTSRIRYVRPDFFTDEDVALLPVKVRLFYIGLWTHADKADRLQDRPQKLKVEIMPFDKRFDSDYALQILAQKKKTSGRPFIIRYKIGDEAFIQIVRWTEHQKPHPTERESEIPPPPSERETETPPPPDNVYLNPNPGLTSGESSRACFACPTPSEPTPSTDLRPGDLRWYFKR